jgi:hypothetical protein
VTAIAFVFVASTVSAQTRSVFIEDLTSYEIRDAMAAGKTSAIIFAGGIEQNGPHMALVKHNLIPHRALRSGTDCGATWRCPGLPDHAVLTRW